MPFAIGHERKRAVMGCDPGKGGQQAHDAIIGRQAAEPETSCVIGLKRLGELREAWKKLASYGQYVTWLGVPHGLIWTSVQVEARCSWDPLWLQLEQENWTMAFCCFYIVHHTGVSLHMRTV